MKRIITLAAAVLAVVACSKENVVDIQREVTFEVAKRVQTRATSGVLYDTGLSFGTYAWYTATTAGTTGSDHADFMVNEKVSFDGSVWKTADNTFYWPKTGSVDFISYSPFAGTSNTAGTVPAVTQNSITYTGYTVNTTDDLMYADKVVGCSANVNEITDDAVSGTDSGYSGVPTLFRHALAKVGFQIKANFTEYADPLDASKKTTWEVTVTSAKISGLYTTGDCALTLNSDGTTWKKPETTVNSQTHNVWSNPSGATAEQELVNATTYPSGVVLTTTAKELDAASGYVLPQILKNNVQKIELVLHIKTTLPTGNVIEEDYNPTFNIKDISTLRAWEMNQNILYTINIKPTAKADGAAGHDDDPEDVIITFDPAVADWTSVSASATIQL